jgi:CarboxypepD_reg-like domain
VDTTATFSGTVTDSTNKPIAKAEVTLPDIGKGTSTNEQGAFVLRDVPGGSQRVLVRHVGYGQVEMRVAFVAGQTTQRQIVMIRSTALDSVVVTGKSVDHQLDDFEVNRKLGLGHFLTRAELAPQEGRSTAAVLTSLPGIKVFTAGPFAWAGSKRHNQTSMKPNVLPDEFDTNKGAPFWDCFALVFVDDHRVFSAKFFPNTGSHVQSRYVWEPLFDVNSIPIAEIEALEYYATAAETPMRYAALNSECGVLVIHTIRFHPKDTTAAEPKPPAHGP